MKSAEENEEVKVELKYCERCGALGTRQCGSGGVYCESCLLEVAELPPARKRPKRLILPVHPRSIIERYEVEEDDESTDSESTGGAA